MIKRKKNFMEYTHSAIQLCLSDEVLRDVVEGTTSVELLTNLKTLYITKSLMN